MDRMKLKTGETVIEVENPDAPLRDDIHKRMAEEIANQIQSFMATKVIWAFEEAKRTGQPVTVAMDGPEVTITPPQDENTSSVLLLESSS